MPRLRHVVVCIFASWLACASAAENAVRVVSQTVGTDEILYALAAPSQIAALSFLSTEPEFSAVHQEAKLFPQLPKNADVENVLSFQPTLVLCANYSRPELVAQLRRSGLRVIVIEHYESLADAYANLRLIARELGPAAEKKAEQIIANCEARITLLRDTLQGAKAVRVIAPSTYNVIGGSHTTFQDLCDHAGAENLAASLGKIVGHAAPPTEQMLTWPIDRVVVSGKTLPAALDVFRHTPPYQFMPVIRESRGVLLRPHLMSSVTHHRVDGYEELARALHPELFK